ncbi:MAG: NUMOD3 domain-containing DNA-binding protein, partial [Patescibacteria group bacterium]
MIKIICEQCKKSFFISPSRINKIKCCSKKCSNLLKKITMKGKNNPFYGKKHSKKTKEINSKYHFGQTAWNKGKTGIYSEETLK